MNLQYKQLQKNFDDDEINAGNHKNLFFKEEMTGKKFFPFFLI